MADKKHIAWWSVVLIVITMAIVFGSQRHKEESLEATALFDTIRKDLKDVTDAQFRAFEDERRGKVLIGNGYVEEVKEQAFGKYLVFVDLEEPANIFSVSDLEVLIDSETALSLNKGDHVKFKGRIKGIDKTLTNRVILEKATITKYP